MDESLVPLLAYCRRSAVLARRRANAKLALQLAGLAGLAVIVARR